MSLLVYLDTNVFDNLVKKTGGVTEGDELRLRAAVLSQRLTLVASHVNIIETLAAMRSRPEIVGPQLNLIASLADWDRFVRFHSAILEDDIVHFAYNGERANTAFESNQIAVNIRRTVRRVIDNRMDPKELEAIMQEDSEQKKAFLSSVKKSRSEIAVELEELRKRGDVPTFEEWFEDSAQDYLRAFVESFSVADECKRRGLGNLFRIRSVRAFIGSSMSFFYRTAAEGKAPKSSSSRDLQHAVCAAAAAADVFVTHDEELASLLRRVPIKDFRVTTLDELLKDVLSASTTAITPC